MPTNYLLPWKGGIAINKASASPTSSAHAYGGIGVAPKSGVIDRIVFFASSITGTPPTFLARLESVTTTGRPSNTILAAGASATIVPSVGWNTATLSQPYNVTRGELFAWTLTHHSGTINASNTFTCPNRLVTLSVFAPAQVVGGAPAGVQTTTYPTWDVPASLTGICALYNDGSTLIPSVPVANGLNEIVNTSGGSSHVGCRFIADFSCYLHAVECTARLDGSYVIEVRDAVTNAVLASVSGSGRRNQTAAYNWVFFNSPVFLQVGQSYRLVVRCISGTVSVSSRTDSYSVLALQSLFGDIHHTISSDGITWTDTTSILPGIGPLIASPVNGFYNPFFPAGF